MPNPNPSPETRFKTDRKESCVARLAVRVPPSMLEKLKKRENWHEFVRVAIAKALEEEENLKSA